MRPSQILAAVVAMSSVTNAMQVSDVLGNINGLSNVKEILLGRQNNNENNNNNNEEPQRPQATTPPENNNNNNNNNNQDQNQNQNQDQNKDQNKDQNQDQNQNNNNNNNNGDRPAEKSDRPQSSRTGRPKPTSFDPRLPAGGVSMITPAATLGEPFYKVGDWVTFAWNFTSLSVTPKNIDVMATCTANQATYTIAVNMSASETEVFWNTGETPEGQAPFLTNKYTLLIYDSNSSVSAAPQAGYLAPFSGLTFGMYTPQPYVDYHDGWTCPNCNGALSQFERMTISALLMTTGTTIGSLIYFTYAFGLW
ncbi:hypothetical protein LEMA_P076890.1 [Plenodomus lingam JN3]|uniref:DUF7137 domain-containing protein n=1 Tax=Leptosphaeria maculans (strain JN3 / isolate v23.1.3 / race Av1-4-5-6-7-8) TaxID=985895 RepID=E5A905_LEPMJ|nr:hypothetical protein LEMA_P076890.1 [Plenodomus lingam JN3]CBY00100.1 hypothetical protein LEMA_P076890.1 [Plenodomus lingam JN3]